MRIKIDPADKMFSWFVRERDNWMCNRCHTPYEPPTMALHNSHYFGRGAENVRFDPDNGDALCFGCHGIWEKQDREDYREFKIRQLGEKGFRDLTIRSKLYCRKDRTLAYLVAKKMFEDLLKKKEIDSEEYFIKFKLLA